MENGRNPVVRIVDDDASFLRALSRRLGAAGFDIEAFDSGEAFLARSGDTPGCVVVDLNMPGLGGLDLQQRIARSDNPLPVIFLTAFGDVPTSVRAMRQGAVNFLSKPVDGEELVSAVREALTRDAEARTLWQQRRDLATRYATLTAREREVFARVCGGLLNKEIAYELGTSERTVKAHRARVMAKMDARSVADLARAAERLDLNG